MLRIGKLAGLVTGAWLALFAGEASALPVYDTNISASDFTGLRSIAGGGLIDGGGSFTAATINWTITSNGDGSLHYLYSIDTNSQQGLSHFILDLSNDCTAIGDCFHNPIMTGGTLDTTVFGTYTSANGNPGMPAGSSIIGVKASPASGTGLADFTFAFDSIRVPVWGNFYAKGGNGTSNGFSLYNAGLGLEASDSDIGDFVPMPDHSSCATELCGAPPCTENCGGTKVPEPASLALLCVGLLGAGFASRRRGKLA